MAAAKKETYLNKVRPAGGREGLALPDRRPARDRALARRLGFRYVFDQASSIRARERVDGADPDGRVSKYFYGIDYPPKDLRLGLIEASGGKIGTPVDQVLLYCYHTIRTREVTAWW